MKKSIVLLGILAAVVYAAPLKAEIVFDTKSGMGLTADGTDFMNGLYEGYTGLRNERYKDLDAIDAEHFNHKAQYGQTRPWPDPILVPF